MSTKPKGLSMTAIVIILLVLAVFFGWLGYQPGTLLNEYSRGLGLTLLGVALVVVLSDRLAARREGQLLAYLEEQRRAQEDTQMAREQQLLKTQLVREVAWLYRAQDGQPAVTLDVEDGLKVEADAVRVRQLLHNLIRNAQEALEGQPDGAVTVGARRVPGGDREFVAITVEDNGPGIGADVLTSLFEPYVTSKKKGTGLGLAIVKKLVEEHGGTVAADNLPGKGARLTVTLPVQATVRDPLSETRPARAEPWRERA